MGFIVGCVAERGHRRPWRPRFGLVIDPVVPSGDSTEGQSASSATSGKDQQQEKSQDLKSWFYSKKILETLPMSSIINNNFLLYSEIISMVFLS